MNRYPITELFQVVVNLSKHQSLIKTEITSQRWSTIGALCSSVAAWCAFASMTFHHSDIELRVEEVKRKRLLLMQQRNEQKLNENLNDIVNTVNENSDWIIQKVEPLLIPLFSGLTVFLGCYILGRRQSFKKHLSELIRERQKTFPNDPLFKSLLNNSNNTILNNKNGYKPLSEIKIK